MPYSELKTDDSNKGPPPLPENYGKPLKPTSSRERIASLDVLRGLALLGILIANMLYFSRPLEVDEFRSSIWFSYADWFADWVSVLLVEAKFYPLFSILFGLGFALQMNRAAARGLDFKKTYRRRIFILAGFGLAHGILIWEGDILLAYALCGFALMLFRNRKSRTIAIWAAVLILLPALLILLVGLVFFLLSGNPEISAVFEELSVENLALNPSLVTAFVTGGYADAVAYRLGEFVTTFFMMMVFAPPVLGLFLIGLLIGRKRILTEVSQHRSTWVRSLVICGIAGLLGNFLAAWAIMEASASHDWGLVLIGTGILSIFGPVLTFAYIAAVALMMQRVELANTLRPIASIGQMALTNYLAQSVIATTIFYGYGFGFGGSVGRLGTIGIALAIFAAQIMFSVMWLKFFRYGPAEWLWRRLSYKKL